MRRRELIALVGGAAIWPVLASAQQRPGMPHVVQLSPVDIASQADQTRGQLRELGYVEARNIRLEFRNAAGNVDAGELPFERPTKLDLRINLRVAKALGIELSPITLARADEVIE